MAVLLLAFSVPGGAPIAQGADPIPQPMAPAGRGLKLYTTEESLVRFDLERLAPVLPAWQTIPPQELCVWNQGEKVPFILRQQGDDHLAPGDAILFYARQLHGTDDGEHLYCDHNVYWLTWDDEPGLGYQQVNGTPDGSPECLWGRDAVRLECECEAVMFESGLYWLSYTLNGRSEATIPLSLENPAAAAGLTAQIRIRLLRRSQVPEVNPDHHWRLSLNGRMILDRWEEDQGFSEAEVAAPNGWLAAQNQILLENLADTGAGELDVIILDRIEVEYWKELSSSAAIASFMGASAGRIRVTYVHEGVPCADPLVLDVTAARQFIGCEALPQGGRQCLRFSDAAEGTARYVIGDADQAAPVSAIAEPVPCEGLASAGGEYVVITPEAFRPAAELYAQYRGSQGWTNAVVTVEGIYDAFGGGIPGPEPLRRFFAYALQQWQPPPRYVTLLGDESWDPRHRLPDSQATSFIPSLLPFPAMDLGLACCRGDDLVPDLCLSRVPAFNMEHAMNYLAKLIAFENQPAPLVWMNNYLLVSAGETAAERDYWESQSEDLARLIDTHRCQGFVRRIYKGQSPGDYPEQIGAAAVDGCAYLNYYGHAGVVCWEDMLWTSNIAAWDNGLRLPVVFSGTCYTGDFSEPVMVSLGEQMLRLDRDQAGALTFIGASATTNSETNHLIGSLVLDAITQQHIDIVSEALAFAARTYLEAGLAPEWLFLYNQLGDSLARIHPARPSRLLAGSIAIIPSANGSALHALGWVQRGYQSSWPIELQVLLDGQPTGLFLYDDGNHGDLSPGDQLYGLDIALPAQLSPSSLSLQIGGVDLVGRALDPWPELVVPEY